MSSMTVGDLVAYLSEFPDDYEVIMNIRHLYDIPKSTGEKGWLAYINGICVNDNFREIKLLN